MDSHITPSQVGASAINSAIQGNSAITANNSASEHLLVLEEDRLALIYYGKGLRCKCLCGETFNTCPALERHIGRCASIAGSVQSSTLSLHRCSKCLVSLSTMARMSAHYKTCIANLDPIARLRTSTDRSSHDQGEGSSHSHICRFCPRTFTTVTGRGVHERAAHGVQLSSIAPQDKTPRWSEAEHDLLIEAEAAIRITHSLEDERVIRNFPLNDEIYAYMQSKLPGFNRSWTSVQQRRTHGAVDAYFAAVLARKQVMLEQAAALSANQNLLASIRRPECANNDGEDGSSSQVRSGASNENDILLDRAEQQCLSASSAATHTCSCEDELRAAIDSHFDTLARVDNSDHVLQYLKGILSGLDTYESARLSEIMRRGRARMITGATTDGSRDGSQNESHRGKKSSERAAAVAIERNLLETRGHKRCLQHLRNPSDAGLCSRQTVELFKAVFEDDAGAELDTAPYLNKPTAGDSHVIHKPVDPAEVVTQLRRLPKNTAPGPDGIRSDDLQDIAPADLACLFNIFLLHKDVPSALKLNKTTMIPKCEDPGVGDWRPITVASIVDRLFAKVLEARLSRAVMLDPNQRGFLRSLDGCGENITAYSGALRYSRTHIQPLAIVSIDLAKAFDSIKYSTIERALARLGVDARSIRLLMNLCHGHTTIIKHQEGSESVELRKGVRQGWPLSPVLFLCVVDELLSQLSPADGFQIVSPSLERASLTGLAFADDIILYSSSSHGMQRHLEKLVSWCSARGLRINPNKSTVLYLRRVPHMKKVLVTPLDISINGVSIPQVSDTYERVLGVHMHHTGKINHGVDRFSRDLELVCNSKLRPTQKISMIACCLLPMIKFRLVYGFANKGALSQVDKIVRKVVRRVYHLPQYINNEVIHTARKYGGLGLPCLAESVPMAQARLTNRMLNSGNATTRILADTRVQSSLSRSHSDFLGGRRLDETTIASLQDNLQKGRLDRFNSSIQGAGWSLFNKAPRLFLDDPRSRGWSERDAIDGMKMRANVLMTRELIARTVARGQRTAVTCRACHQAVETQTHILSKCSTTQADRVARHDSVCAYLARRLQKARTSQEQDSLGDRVHREFRVVMQPGEAEGIILAHELRPDIAVIREDRIVIIEVSVVYEAERGTDDNTLKLVRRDKLSKYEPLKRVLAARFNRRCEVQTLIVGCRGGWLATNNKVFHGTGVPFTEHDKNCCVERAVRGSLITFRRFHGRTFEPLRLHDRQ